MFMKHVYLFEYIENSKYDMSIIDLAAQSGLPPASESKTNRILGFKGSLKTGAHRKIEKLPLSQTTRFYRGSRPVASPEIQELLYDFSRDLGNSDLKSSRHPSLSFTHPMEIRRSRLNQPPESIRLSQQKRPKTSIPQLNLKKARLNETDLNTTRNFNFSGLEIGSAFSLKPQSLTARPNIQMNSNNSENEKETLDQNNDNEQLNTEKSDSPENNSILTSETSDQANSIDD